MNELVGLPPVPVRYSLILIGLLLRTCSAVVPLCRGPWPGAVHAPRPVRSPSNGAGPEVTVKVALTLAPGATASKVWDVSSVPVTTEVHPSGFDRLSFTPETGALLVLVNVSVTC
jgi:hypothetical protein